MVERSGWWIWESTWSYQLIKPFYRRLCSHWRHMDDEESAQQSWRDEHCPCEMVMNKDLIWEQGSRGIEVKANSHWCSADTTEPGELPQGRGSCELYSKCLRDCEENDTFKVCFKRILNLVGMDGKDRSQEEKEETPLSPMTTSLHLLYSSGTCLSSKGSLFKIPVWRSVDRHMCQQSHHRGSSTN